MNQPPKTFYSFNWRHAGQGNEITLPSFILSQNLLQICPVLSSVFPSVTLLHSPFLSFSLGLLAWKLSVSKMKFPNCCKWLAICVNGWDEKAIIITAKIQKNGQMKMAKKIDYGLFYNGGSLGWGMCVIWHICVLRSVKDAFKKLPWTFPSISCLRCSYMCLQ